MTTSTEIFEGKILVVDDQEQAARAVVEMLRDAGYRNVTFCTNARLVKDLHVKQRFDGVLRGPELMS